MRFLEEALASVDRYNAEPTFSNTGKGYLRPATAKERARETARSEALVRRLEERMKIGGTHEKSETGIKNLKHVTAQVRCHKPVRMAPDAD